MSDEKKKSTFDILSAIDVSGLIDKKATGKNELSYLSWANAIKEVKKVFPDISYNIIFFDGKPYLFDENLGYMVFTNVTIQGQTIDMWLPVMDGSNKAMKKEPYTYKTKYGENRVEAATYFDINKTLMRCLAKNIAMFGLGISLFAGDDLYDSTDEVIEKKETKKSEPKVEKKETYLCEECNAVIEDYTAKDKFYPAATLYKNTLVKYGKHLCIKCMQSAEMKLQKEKEVAND